MVVLDGNFALGWNGLPLNAYISMSARTNRCYNERGSRTNYVRSSTTDVRLSVPHSLSLSLSLSIYIYIYTHIYIYIYMTQL
jgi:hypothetical protein